LPSVPTSTPVSTKSSETSPFNESTVEIAPWYYNSVLEDNGYIKYQLCLFLRNKTSKPIFIKGSKADNSGALVNVQVVSLQTYAETPIFWKGIVRTDQGKEYDAVMVTPWWEKGSYVLMPNVPVTGWQYGLKGLELFCYEFSVPEKLKPTKIFIAKWSATGHEIAFDLAPGIDKLGKLAIDSSGAKPIPAVFTLGKKLEITASQLATTKDQNGRLLSLKLHNPSITDSIEADPFVSLVDADGVLVFNSQGIPRTCVDKNNKMVYGKLGPDQTWTCTYEFYFAYFLANKLEGIKDQPPVWVRMYQAMFKNTGGPFYVIISEYDDAVLLK
jgi:hypothetical protein